MELFIKAKFRNQQIRSFDSELFEVGKAHEMTYEEKEKQWFLWIKTWVNEKV